MVSGCVASWKKGFMQSMRTMLMTCCAAFIAAAGCTARQPQPASAPGAPPVTNVARSNIAGSLVMGDQSCASSGCHGRTFDGQSRDWRAAWSIWREEDPHRRAFEVLYSERAVEIYRNFHPDAKRSPEAPSDPQFEAFLGQRCLGCHATGLRGRDGVALAEVRDRPAYYLAGITCESCHGPASGWLHTHYLASFSRTSPGFQDTKSLHRRAEACVGCHVGPMVAASGRTFDVNHDLIAAGHPRLAFEFSAYLANLPKHWNEYEEMVSHQPIGQPMTYHIDVWAAGQEQVARQLVRQIEHRLQSAKRDPSVTPWPDFSNYDCYDCHHAIVPPGDERVLSAQRAGRRNAPRPAVSALDSLRHLSGGQSGEPVNQTVVIMQSLLANSWELPLERTAQPTAEQFGILTNQRGAPLPALDGKSRRQQHAAHWFARLQSWKRPDSRTPGSQRYYPTWSELLDLYFALGALAQDMELQQPGTLHSVAANLADTLEGSFGDLNRPPTLYDSPSSFPPADLQRALTAVEQALLAVARTESPANSIANP